MLILILKAAIIFEIGNIFGILTSMLVDQIVHIYYAKVYEAERKREALKMKARELIYLDRGYRVA